MEISGKINKSYYEYLDQYYISNRDVKGFESLLRQATQAQLKELLEHYKDDRAFAGLIESKILPTPAEKRKEIDEEMKKLLAGIPLKANVILQDIAEMIWMKTTYSMDVKLNQYLGFEPENWPHGFEDTVHEKLYDLLKPALEAAEYKVQRTHRGWIQISW